MRFHRHFNHAIGKEIHTNREYLSEMKKKGLEPFREVKRPERKQYKPSGWAHDMVRAIERTKDKDGNVHLKSVVLDQLQSNLKAVPQNLRDKVEGGFYQGGK